MSLEERCDGIDVVIVRRRLTATLKKVHFRGYGRNVRRSHRGTGRHRSSDSSTRRRGVSGRDAFHLSAQFDEGLARMSAYFY